MPRTSDKRERLRDAAFHLARQRGIVGWTLADVAESAGVPQGSVYYHYKTKDAMVHGVIDALDDHFIAALEGCSAQADPRDRLYAFIDLYSKDTAVLRSTGPALGSLGTDLRRSAPDHANAVAAVYERVLRWIQQRFEDLGFTPSAARARSLHLLTGLEGAAELAHGLNSSEPLERETAHLRRWVERATPTAP